MKAKLRFRHEGKVNGNLIFILLVAGIVASFFINPPTGDSLGWYTIVPSIFAISYIFYSKDVIMAYMIAGILGTLFMTKKLNFATEYFDRMFETAMSESFMWLVIVCGMMGTIIVLIENSGGAFAFSRWVAKYIHTKKGAMLATFGLGAAIFTDDYLNSLAIGPSMAAVTDEKKVSREMLSYIVDTMAAAPCVLIPISTWAAFIGSVLEANKIAPVGEGVKYFIKTIPYNFYAMAAILVCFLVIIGVIPLFGKLKKAELRAETTGVLAPPGSDKIAMHAEGEKPHEEFKNAKLMNLFVPLIVLVVLTFISDMDMFMGCILTLIFCLIFFMVQKLLTLTTFVDSMVEGFKSMTFIFVLVCFSYTFTATLTEMGFAEYVVEKTMGFITPEMLPFIFFLVFGITEFMTGTNWDLYMLILPVVVPLATAIGADPYLSVAAVISAGVWGSHVCPASDATVCTSAACGCENYEHATSQMPYAIIAFVMAGIGYIIAGFLI